MLTCNRRQAATSGLSRSRASAVIRCRDFSLYGERPAKSPCTPGRCHLDWVDQCRKARAGHYSAMKNHGDSMAFASFRLKLGVCSNIYRKSKLEIAMTAYIPALIWLFSAMLCLRIAKHRHVKPTAIWAMIVAVLGPIAIPLVLLAKPEKFNQA